MRKLNTLSDSLEEEFSLYGSEFLFVGTSVPHELPELSRVSEHIDTNQKANHSGSSDQSHIFAETSESSSASQGSDKGTNSLSGTKGSAGPSENCTHVQSRESTHGVESVSSVDVLLSAVEANSVSLNDLVVLENHFVNYINYKLNN